MSNWISQVLAERYPTIASAASEIASLKAQLVLSKGVIHVISDVHGEDKKLRHVVTNASGRLRPLLEELFSDELDEEAFREFVSIVYYPGQFLKQKGKEFGDDQDERFQWIYATLQRQFRLIRRMSRDTLRRAIPDLVPPEHQNLFKILLNFPAGAHSEKALLTQLEELVERNLAFPLIYSTSRVIRTLSISELIVAGDLGDRGPRLDRVIDLLRRTPNTSLIWGNHDVSWMGACLGQEALIAIVLRISLRYRRLFQLEEGYGILTKALEHLAENAYGDDPAEQFVSRRDGERDSLLIARMQKAAAILEFKLQGQTIERHPEWEMDDRNILKAIDFENGSILIDRKSYALSDRYLPTIDPKDPNQLSEDEQHCMDRLKESFMNSPRLWRHMLWAAENGQMSLVRDRAAIFHACLAVDEKGNYLPLTIDGRQCRGSEQFTAFNRVIKRAFRDGRRASNDDKDWFYYLWAGPRSPLFGKDRMATFEMYFIKDEAAHKEHKNPWFKWIHDFEFCDRVCQEMGIPEGGLLINGHVPVKISSGESPLKNGGNAITIDGAFSEAYGDQGYTLILAPEGEILAKHHQFKDPVEAVIDGKDLIPTTMQIRKYDKVRLLNDTEEGAVIRANIEALEELIKVYEDGVICERS